MNKKGKESPFFINRVGEKHNLKGEEVEIIEYFGWDNCTIRFQDGSEMKNIRYFNLTRGKVKNPYKPSVCGLGYLGVGKHVKKINKVSSKVYSVWSSMIRRCENGKRSTYQDVKVCKEWECFQNFGDWFEENYKSHMEGWELDKDILIKGNKIYSPETCAFVPKEINNLFVKNDKGRGKLPIGVSFCKMTNKFKVSSEYGNGKTTFDTPEQAFNTYKIAKENRIKEIADEWQPLIEDRVYQAMYNYQVEITD